MTDASCGGSAASWSHELSDWLLGPVETAMAIGDAGRASLRGCSSPQAERCTMSIEVLPETETAGHKVKIQGVIIAEDTTQAGDVPWGTLHRPAD